MPCQRRVLAHRNRHAPTVHAAGASTPRTCAAPAGGRLSWPTRPPLLTTRPGGASDNGRTARRRPRPLSPLKPPTPARRRSGPGARQRPSTIRTDRSIGNAKPARARLVHPGQHPLDVLAGDGAACFRSRMAGTAPSIPAGITRRVARKHRNVGAAVTGLRRADRPSRLARVYANAAILGTVSRNQPGVGVPAHSARRAAALRPCIRRVPTTNPTVASLQALLMTGRNVQFLTAVNVLSR